MYAHNYHTTWVLNAYFIRKNYVWLFQFGYCEIIKPRKWLVVTHNKGMIRKVNAIRFLNLCVTINSQKMNVNFLIRSCWLTCEC